MGARAEITKDLYADVIKDPRVRAALRSVAEEIKPRIERIAREVGAVALSETVAIESGTRPGTKSAQHIERPFERVIITAIDAVAREYGDVNQNKQAILRRAIEAGWGTL